MKKSLLLVVLFLSFSNSLIKSQTKENIQVIDTLYNKPEKEGFFTIEQDIEVKNNLIKYQTKACKQKNVAQNNIVIHKTDITNVPLADKCILTPKIMGYKIQVYYTKDRTNAEKVKTDFEKYFPNLTSEVKYLQPDFKVLIGDYLSKRSASVNLNNIKRKYNAAFIIPFPVRCRVAE